MSISQLLRLKKMFKNLTHFFFQLAELKHLLRAVRKKNLTHFFFQLSEVKHLLRAVHELLIHLLNMVKIKCVTFLSCPL